MQKHFIARAAATAVFVALVASPAAYGDRLALLPVENLSGEPVAGELVADLIAESLTVRGWEILGEGELEDALRARRIRRYDSLRRDVASDLAEELRLAALALPAVWSYRDEGELLFAMSLRLLAPDGDELWSGTVGLAGTDVQGALALRKPASASDLAVEAIRRLLGRFPGSAAAAAREIDRRRRPRWLPEIATFRSANWPDGVKPLVCLLPFDNVSREQLAPRIAADLLARRLVARGVAEVVEPAELRAALLAGSVPTLQHLDPERLRVLAGRVGTTFFLRGTVREWREGTGEGSAAPRVGLDFELVDVSTGDVLWASQASRRGDEYAGLLLRGSYRSAAALADQLLSEMVDAVALAEPVAVTGKAKMSADAPAGAANP